jgi:hypothetical protein
VIISPGSRQHSAGSARHGTSVARYGALSLLEARAQVVELYLAHGNLGNVEDCSLLLVHVALGQIFQGLGGGRPGCISWLDRLQLGRLTSAWPDYAPGLTQKSAQGLPWPRPDRRPATPRCPHVGQCQGYDLVDNLDCGGFVLCRVEVLHLIGQGHYAGVIGPYGGHDIRSVGHSFGLGAGLRLLSTGD